MRAKAADPGAFAGAGGSLITGYSFANISIHAQPRENGLPGNLKASMEWLSGLAMDDVRVHFDSAEPVALGAEAFTRGSDIHLAAGQERHLPHEAWHAVQQKQGRANSTARVGSARVNDDAALEAEADRMGDRALAAAPAATPTMAAASPPAGEGVVQPKLKWKGSWVQESSSLSEVARQYVKRPEPFLLRGDVTPQDKTIHALDMSKKYLLGEVHNSGVWEAETKPWGDVDKMTEAYKTMPHETDDKAGVFDVPYDPARMPDGQPLESSHPFLFASLMQAQGAVETLLDFMKTDPDEPQKWKTWVRAGLEHLDEVKTLYVDYYKPYWETFERKYRPTLRDPATRTYGAAPARLEKIYGISTRLRNAYYQGWTKGSELFELTRVLKEIDGVIRSGAAPRKGWSGETAATIRKRSGFFADVAKDVAALLPATAEQAKIFGDIITTPDPFKRPDVLQAVDPIRERSMADNIGAGPTPLLVQLGVAHMDPVAKLVGPAAVPVGPPRKLREVTRRS